MEAELENMLVEGWFQGERAKLLLRVSGESNQNAFNIFVHW